MRSLTALVVTGALIFLTGCERWELDRKMKELCAKDGGVKVYETVKLAASEFSNIGQPLAKYERLARSVEDMLGPDYRYVLQKQILVGANADLERGQGRLERIREAVYRRTDDRLLGESIWYARGGGDFITFGFHPSGSHCPKPAASLINSIFLKGA
jgi:hypothetical protein